jgi:hypothetical protein
LKEIVNHKSNRLVFTNRLEAAWRDHLTADDRNILQDDAAIRDCLISLRSVDYPSTSDAERAGSNVSTTRGFGEGKLNLSFYSGLKNVADPKLVSNTNWAPRVPFVVHKVGWPSRNAKGDIQIAFYCERKPKRRHAFSNNWFWNLKYDSAAIRNPFKLSVCRLLSIAVWDYREDTESKKRMTIFHWTPSYKKNTKKNDIKGLKLSAQVTLQMLPPKFAIVGAWIEAARVGPHNEIVQKPI